LVYFTAIWYILLPFGTFCSHLVYFFPFWFVAPSKIGQPCRDVDEKLENVPKKMVVQRSFRLRCYVMAANAAAEDWLPQQGDQFGRIFSCWAIVLFGQFFLNTEEAKTFWATLFTIKVMYLLCEKNGLGYILGDFSHTHPVTLVGWFPSSLRL
jgi:hypothetical protein